MDDSVDNSADNLADNLADNSADNLAGHVADKTAHSLAAMVGNLVGNTPGTFRDSSQRMVGAVFAMVNEALVTSVPSVNPSFGVIPQESISSRA